MDEKQPTPSREKETARSAHAKINLADRTVAEVLDSVASEDISPGAGAAGAVALALAAACAGKAVSISLKRRPDDAVLLRARGRLAELGHRALRGAEADASRFEDFVRDKDAAAADRLIGIGEWLQLLADDLEEALRELEGRIDRAVLSDVTAARALGRAFVTIQSVNLDENRRAADEMK
jgi:hypothetical protein